MKNPLLFAVPTAAVFLLQLGVSSLSDHGHASSVVLPFGLAFVAGLAGLRAWIVAPLYVLAAAPAIVLAFCVTFGVVGVRRWRRNANDRHERRIGHECA